MVAEACELSFVIPGRKCHKVLPGTSDVNVESARVEAAEAYPDLPRKYGRQTFWNMEMRMVVVCTVGLA